jgi:hypothetical protein
VARVPRAHSNLYEELEMTTPQNVCSPPVARVWPSAALRTLAICLGLVTAATASAAPVRADSLDDTFTSVVDAVRGTNDQDSGGIAELGRSICPMLERPGETFASTASSITGHDGMSPAMAGLFTRLAISMYCPSMMTSLANGDMPSLPHVPGLPGR